MKLRLTSLLTISLFVAEVRAELLGFGIQSSEARSVTVGTTRVSLFGPLTVSSAGAVALDAVISGFSTSGTRRVFGEVHVNGKNLGQRFIQDLHQNTWKHVSFSTALDLQQNDTVEIFARTSSGTVRFDANYGNFNTVESVNFDGIASLGQSSLSLQSSSILRSTGTTRLFRSFASRDQMVSIEGSLSGLSLSGSSTVRAELLVNGTVRQTFEQTFDSGRYDNLAFSAALDLQQGDTWEVLARTDTGVVRLDRNFSSLLQASEFDGTSAFESTSFTASGEVSTALTELFNYTASQNERVSLDGGFTGLSSDFGGALFDGDIRINGQQINQFRQQFVQGAKEHLSFSSVFNLRKDDLLQVFGKTETGTVFINPDRSPNINLLTANRLATVPEPSALAFWGISALLCLAKAIYRGQRHSAPVGEI